MKIKIDCIIKFPKEINTARIMSAIIDGIRMMPEGKQIQVEEIKFNSEK